MANRVLLKKSSVAGRVPQVGDLEYGELALNYSDGKLYYKSAGNVISSFAADLSSYVTLSGTQTLSNKTLINADFQGTTEFLGVSGTSEYIAYFKGGGEGSKLGVAVSGLAADGIVLESFTFDSSAHAKLSINGSRLEFNVPLHSGALVVQENGIVNASDGLTVNNVAVVTTTGTQTLTNKTLTSPTINNGTLALTTGTLRIPTSANPAQTEEGDIVWNSSLDLLTVGTGAGRRTMVDTTSAQTLTNKTLTAPSISAATLTGSLTVSNGTGTSGQVLTSTGSGLQWATVQSGGGSQYTLPTATDTTLGGVKIGSGISIDVDGVITAFSGSYSDLSGKPTIPSAIFSTVAVAGQSNIVADSATDTLTLVAGDNITITTNATNDSITISSTASGGGGGSQYTLPIASVSTLGGIKIGSGLSIDNTGVVDVIGASGSTASGVVPYDMGYITEIVYTVQDHGSIV